MCSCDTVHGLRVWTDDVLRQSTGVVIGFSQRVGGVSKAPFASLNLASHVGDEPAAVDENRRRLLDALALGEYREWLTMAEQVHDCHIALVDDASAGAGAFANRGRDPLARTDALMTRDAGVPLALCFADCVPIILVAPGPAIAVVHAGWRGALVSLVGSTAIELANLAGCEATALTAYIGPHIRACHYEVSPEIMSQFVNTFGTFARASSGGLDLDAVVSASLDRAGVAPCNIARLGTCTAEATDRFFSYRAEGGRTGRHVAVACILPRP
jgi:YfiH family protein